MSFYVSTATFFLLHCDEWDRVVALPRHKFVTGATLLQLLTAVKLPGKCTRDDLRSFEIVAHIITLPPRKLSTFGAIHGIFIFQKRCAHVAESQI